MRRVGALVVALVLGAGGSRAQEQDTRTEKIYRIGIAPADVDTPVEKYFDTVNGIDTQCAAVNRVIESTCCAEYKIGCHVRYECEGVEVDDEDLMQDAAYSYEWEEGYPSYPMHHIAVVREVQNVLKATRLYGRHHRMLVVAYTRHRIRVDDESTKEAELKVKPGDLRFQFLGMIVPELTARDGRLMILNYYANKDSILLSVSPSLDTSLAQGIAEYRSTLFSFDEKVFTGTGTRDLFELGPGGSLVPNATGCVALADREPPHLTELLEGNR